MTTEDKKTELQHRLIRMQAAANLVFELTEEIGDETITKIAEQDFLNEIVFGENRPQCEPATPEDMPAAEQSEISYMPDPMFFKLLSDNRNYRLLSEYVNLCLNKYYDGDNDATTTVRLIGRYIEALKNSEGEFKGVADD